MDKVRRQRETEGKEKAKVRRKAEKVTKRKEEHESKDKSSQHRNSKMMKHLSFVKGWKTDLGQKINTVIQKI